jgi:uncharacterized membrane protein YeiH
LAAGRKRLDTFGVFVLGLVTAVGGGTLRDLLLGQCPVFWIKNPYYLIVIIGACIFTLLFAKCFIISMKTLLIFDALGLAVFTIIGMFNSLSVISSEIIAGLMGIMTGVVGGILRDTLSAEVPLILRREIYATACLCGVIAYLVLTYAGVQKSFCVVFSCMIIFLLRVAAIHWNFSLPVFHIK